MSRSPRVNVLCLAVASLLLALARTAVGQPATQTTIQTTRPTPVLERPRGDSLGIASVPADVSLKVVKTEGRWFQVEAPSGASWSRGWVIVRDPETLAAANRQLARGRTPLPPQTRRIRAFGEGGYNFLTARKSAEALFGKASASSFGGGVQLVQPSGLFIQAAAERFSKTGSRVLVSGTQVLRLAAADTVTLTPVTATIGYWQMSRQARKPVASYVGVGGGVVSFAEESGTDSTSARRPEIHLLGGLEYRVRPGVWIGGELRWRTVPKSLGAGGLGEYYDERDLGGSTFLLKIVIGK